MKRVFWIAITILGTLWFSSCEDVIEVDLPDTDRRLVIDGLIRVDTTQEFVDVKVKVTETSSFSEISALYQTYLPSLFFMVLKMNLAKLPVVPIPTLLK